jgi:hypothetical protein
MKIIISLFILSLLTQIHSQPIINESDPLLSPADFQFLEKMTKDVMESSRIYPGEEVAAGFGSNNTGGVLIRPGGRDCYPAFWIRDYAISLESGLISPEEQRHMLLLTASTQCNQSWITTGGSLIPYGAIADHVRVDDGRPIYFPGTYSYEAQGVPEFGILPPISDQFFFVHMAYMYLKTTGDSSILDFEIKGLRLFQRLEIAYHSATSRSNIPLVYTTEHLRGVDFGFRDVQVITGDLCFPSILKFRASHEMAWLSKQLDLSQKAASYTKTAEKLKELIPLVFSDSRGMLKASNGRSGQADVWSTALAVHLGILEGESLEKTCHFLANAYLEGTLAYRGNIRHILTTDDFSETSAWEISLAQKNTYQNGAYWGTPVGWVVDAISRVDPKAAQKLAIEYLTELRENDYRKGPEYGAPFECFHPSGKQQNPVYLTSVSSPYGVFKKLMNRNN